MWKAYYVYISICNAKHVLSLANIYLQIHNWHAVNKRGFSANEPPYWILDTQHAILNNMTKDNDPTLLWNNLLLEVIRNWSVLVSKYTFYTERCLTTLQVYVNKIKSMYGILYWCNFDSPNRALFSCIRIEITVLYLNSCGGQFYCGRNLSTRRNSPTYRKILTNYIT
jgi:hypothetical protein